MTLSKMFTLLSFGASLFPAAALAQIEFCPAGKALYCCQTTEELDPAFVFIKNIFYFKISLFSNVIFI
jgi:hypothetical protein